MPAASNLTGATFGRLTVNGRARIASTRVHWNCTCKCGGRRIVRTDRLLSGDVDCCGSQCPAAP